jgi:hydroxyethylthiazole kinase-like uncharacterized protein yjeF
MGRIVVADIGVHAESLLSRLVRPSLTAPGPDDHKFTRGYVAVLAGEMPGAAVLAASAAARAGTGYVRLVAPRHVPGLPAAVVQSEADVATVIADERVGAVLVGPGLGRSQAARELLHRALACARPLVLDADALVLLGEEGASRLQYTPVLTPHAGEFARMFSGSEGSKVATTRAAAARSGAVLVYKGADTVLADPDGRAAIAPPTSAWLASAGTGDVLAGVIAAMRARGLGAFEASCAGVWLHGAAARRLSGPFIADDLVGALPSVVAECSA